jgi:desampylase
VIVHASALTAITAHALEAAPAECCGVLLGRPDEVLEAIRARNLADSPVRFVVDPQDHIAARRDARRRGLEVVGFYHSHPHSAPVPSATDLAEAGYPDHLYAIVGLIDGRAPEVCVYRFADAAFQPVAFDTVR